MPKITKLTTDVENQQGFEYDSEFDEVPSFAKGIDLDGGIRLKGQTDGTLSIINPLSGAVTTSVSLDVTSGSGQAVTKVISETLTVEDATTAYQPVSSDLVTSTLDNRGRYEVVLDFQAATNHHTEEYRSKSQTGLTNVRVQVYSVTNVEPTGEAADKWRDVVNDQWWRSYRPVWQSRTRNEILTEKDALTGDYDLGTGDINIRFNEGITFKANEYYRIIISADNAFTLDGNANVPTHITGGVQDFPYIERSYREITSSTGSSGVSVFASDDTLDFQRDATNTSLIADNGDTFAVNGIKAIAEADGSISIITMRGEKDLYSGINWQNVTIAGSAAGIDLNNTVNALNALFTVTQGEVSTSITSPEVDATGVATTNQNYANVADPVGDASFALTSGSHGVVYTDERINEPNEHFTFSIVGKNYHGIGLFDDTTDTDGDGTSDHLEELQAGNTSRYKGNIWSMWIHPTVASWTYYGEQNVAPTVSSGFTNLEGNTSGDTNIRWQSSVEYTNLATTPVGMKVGISVLGYLTVSYFNVVENRYVPIVRFNTPLPQRDYGLYYAMGHSSSQMWDAPKVHLVDEADPILTYYTIQSTDWKYPLFTSEEQANHYDLQNGGSGTSTTQIFPDDPTNGTWYAPDNGYTNNGATQPANTDDIIYNVIPSEVITPTAYTDTTIEVNEGEAFNIAIDPADHNWTTSVSGESWAVLHEGNLTGTAPAVTGDNVANPNDEYTFTITRELEGTSQGTLTIRVINLTVPVNPISGFNHVAGSTAMIDADTMNDGSVVHMNTTVADVQRFIIHQAYVEANILPALQASGDQYIIGLENAASDFSTLELSDFDAAIVWEWESASSHTFKFYRDGSVVQNVVVNSLTDAYYDYAIEADGTSAWLIACNVNNIMNEPSPNDGGVFSYSYEVTNTEDTAPLQIHMATLNTSGDISTTDVEILATPQPPAGTTTPFDKAVDFSGGSEYLAKVNSSYLYTPLNMGNSSSTVAAPTAGQTVASGHPWATSIVFQVDGNASNQHIWNLGEGVNSTDDNIYLRLDASRNLYFGWGRSGALNEILIGSSLSTSAWYGLYIGFNGTRLSGANATAANLADCFEIRYVNLNTKIAGSSLSTFANWGSASSSTGGRMDRQFTGSFTIGGRGANRNFHGKVASMVSTTLRCGVAMPDATEVGLMVTNPIKWVEDYKIGNPYRRPSVTTDSASFALNNLDSASGTQVYLMGDGLSDSYSNGIRSYIYPSEQNRSKMQFNNMVSSDIETVNITGLS